MSLALANVTQSNFDVVHGHLLSRAPRYRNMPSAPGVHPRRRARPALSTRYVRAARASRPRDRGDDLPVQRFSGTTSSSRFRGRVQLNLLFEETTPRALRRLGRRFIPEDHAPVSRKSRATICHHPRRTAGQYYLRRNVGGMQASHPTCARAVTDRVLDQRFVFAPRRLGSLPVNCFLPVKRSPAHGSLTTQYGVLLVARSGTGEQRALAASDTRTVPTTRRELSATDVTVDSERNDAVTRRPSTRVSPQNDEKLGTIHERLRGGAYHVAAP